MGGEGGEGVEEEIGRGVGRLEEEEGTEGEEEEEGDGKKGRWRREGRKSMRCGKTGRKEGKE